MGRLHEFTKFKARLAPALRCCEVLNNSKPSNWRNHVVHNNAEKGGKDSNHR